MTGKVKRKISDFLEEMDRGDARRRSLNPAEAKQFVEEVEKETDKLSQSSRAELERHLESGEDDSITEAILGHIRQHAGLRILVHWLPMSGAVFPAIFERGSIAILEAMKDIGLQ